ncbi:TIGR01777 family oxidoreductase [Luteimonas sp. RD2P54]|uniref:TIGR01777 family oxidoreductase n=1 Tax=Luteimonas endophytica TaxID=3042023 RepID=A0ABT6J645_9GAMM|nr:TIGR01777 family oxidoreductase [Luteimonas endophytica]MDH5822297.1 TIGR01777 family oxidoreductase [Luteimonas endophytica]
MRVLIAGGSGFLGGALTARLVDDGAAVTWLSRTPGIAHSGNVEVRGYDALGQDDHWDAVVNLAGAGIAGRRWSAARKRELLDSRLQPTRRLLEWMAGCRRRPQVLLSGSAVGWYGARGDAPLTEDSGFHDEFVHQLCERWEAAALEAQALGVSVLLLRTGVAMHPDGGMLARLLPPFRLGLGGRLGDGTQAISWIAREDWVEAVRMLLRMHLAGEAEAPEGPVNLTAPQPVTNAGFTAALAGALGRPALLPLPAPLLRLGLGEMSTLLLDGQRVLPERLARLGFRFLHPRLEDALRAQLS